MHFKEKKLVLLLGGIKSTDLGETLVWQGQQSTHPRGQGRQEGREVGRMAEADSGALHVGLRRWQFAPA